MSLVYGAVGIGLLIGLISLLLDYGVINSEIATTSTTAGGVVIVWFTLARIYRAFRDDVEPPKD